MTRRHHPLLGQRLDVVSASRIRIVVRLTDGTAMRMPRTWTDADGPPPEGVREGIFTADSLRELARLLDILGRGGD